MMKTLVAVLTISLWATITAWNAAASECAESSQRRAFRVAVIVFEGTVTNINAITKEETDPTAKVQLQRPLDGSPQLVTFAAERFWKGSPRKTVKVFLFMHPPQGSGYSFKLGEKYLIYALAETTRWAPLRAISNGDPTFAIGDCPLRVRTDIAVEAKSLGQALLPPE